MFEDLVDFKFDFLDYTNHILAIDSNNKDKKINIINIGELHFTSPKFDIDYFKDKKTCFYVELPNYIFKTQKYYRNVYFNNSTKYFNNFRLFFENFAYYFKLNNYKFEDKEIQNITDNSKKYNKNWKFCPCDHRFIKRYPKYYSVLLLLKFYLYNNDILHNLFKNNEFYKTMINNLFILAKSYTTELFNSDKKITLNNNDIKNDYLKLKDMFNSYYECPNITNDLIIKIKRLIKKYYYNENYVKLCKNFTIENLNLYFKNMDISEIIIDMFNLNTYFYYEDKLNKYKCIKSFLNYYFNYYFFNNIIKEVNYQVMLKNSNFYTKPIDYGMYDILLSFSLVYDIGLYIQFCDNYDKYDYNVIYSGMTHKELFDIFINFLNEDNYNIYNLY